MRNLISLPQRTSNQNPSATLESAVHGRSMSFSKAGLLGKWQPHFLALMLYPFRIMAP